jgi:hypothetical protein
MWRALLLHCCCQEYMDNVIVEAFTFNEEEARAAELAAPPAAAALPTEVVRSKVGAWCMAAGLLRFAMCGWCTSVHLWSICGWHSRQSSHSCGRHTGFLHWLSCGVLRLIVIA